MKLFECFKCEAELSYMEKHEYIYPDVESVDLCIDCHRELIEKIEILEIEFFKSK